MSNSFNDIICHRIQALMRQQVLNQTNQTKQWQELPDNRECQLCQAGTEQRYKYMIHTGKSLLTKNSH